MLGRLVVEGSRVVLEGSHGTIFEVRNKNKIKISLILYTCIINLILPTPMNYRTVFKELRLQQWDRIISHRIGRKRVFHHRFFILGAMIMFLPQPLEQLEFIGSSSTLKILYL